MAATTAHKNKYKVFADVPGLDREALIREAVMKGYLKPISDIEMTSEDIGKAIYIAEKEWQKTPNMNNRHQYIFALGMLEARRKDIYASRSD